MVFLIASNIDNFGKGTSVICIVGKRIEAFKQENV